MDIQIITTQKKLSVSIIKQMYELNYNLFDSVEALGFITVGRKYTNKIAICVNGKDYYTLNMLWERRGNYAGYNFSGFKGEMIKRINPDIIDEWFEKYNLLIAQAEEKGHIYL